MSIDQIIEELKKGKKFTSDSFNQANFEYIEYDPKFINPIRFIRKCGYNEPIDLSDKITYREVQVINPTDNMLYKADNIN